MESSSDNTGDPGLIPQPVDRIKEILRWIFDSLVRNASYMMGVTVVNGLTGFVFWTIAARVQTTEQVGLASSIISIIQLLSGIAGLGLGIGLVRFLADAQDPKRMLNSVFNLTLLTSVLVGALYILGLPIWNPSIYLVAQSGWVKFGQIIYLGVTALGALIQLAFLGLRQAKYSFFHALWFNAVRVLVVPLSSTSGFTGIVAAMMVGFFVADLIAILRFIPKALPGYHYRVRLSLQVFRELLPFSVVNYLTNLFMQLPMLIGPPLALELLDAPSSAFAYSGWLIGSMLSGPGMALAQSAFAEGSKSPHKLKEILSRAGMITIVVTTPLAIVLAVGGKIILNVFGVEYVQESAVLLRWIAFTSPMFGLNALYITSLRVRKRNLELLLVSIFIATVAILTPLFGLAKHGLGTLGIGWFCANLVVIVWSLRAYFTDK